MNGWSITILLSAQLMQRNYPVVKCCWHFIILIAEKSAESSSCSFQLKRLKPVHQTDYYFISLNSSKSSVHRSKRLKNTVKHFWRNPPPYVVKDEFWLWHNGQITVGSIRASARSGFKSDLKQWYLVEKFDYLLTVEKGRELPVFVKKIESLAFFKSVWAC